MIICLSAGQTLSQSTQRFKIRGYIIDTDSQKPLPGATVICIRKLDSSKINIAVTDANGEFILDNIPLEAILLNITFIGYQTAFHYVDKPSEEAIINIGRIGIKRSGLTLAPVEITESKKKIRITKDTLEYEADLFKTKTNSYLGDLLNKIPGIEIDNDGTIRVNGEIVETIMINGRELVGMNNSNISRNLQADLIEKIQLIDRKHNQRNPENYNGGQSDKIINITIKENKQNKIQGEISSGYGSNDKFATKFNLSRFTSQQQLFVLANGDNINGTTTSSSGGGVGLQKNLNSAGTFSDIISSKLTINTGYSVSHNKSIADQTSIRENIKSNSNIFYNQQENSKTNNNDNAISIQLEQKIDSLQTISFTNQLTFSDFKNKTATNYIATLDNSKTISSNGLSNDIHSNSFATTSNLRYEKKFAKPGRSIEISVTYSSGLTKSASYIKTNNTYFSSSSDSTFRTSNQLMSKQEKIQQYFFIANYNEPLGKNGQITFSIAEDYLNTQSNRFVYDHNSSTTLYDRLNDSLSNKYQNTPHQHYARVTWSYRMQKIDYSFSLASLQYNTTNTDHKTNTNTNLSIFTVLPDANLNWLISDNKRIRFNYRKSTIYPQNTQLQTISENTDPLYIKRGNPNLKPANEHNINLSLTSIDSRSLRSISIGLTSKIASNQITDAVWFDSTGRQISQPINIKGGYFLNTNLETNIPFKKEKKIYLATNIGLNKSMNSTNGIIGYNKNFNISESIKITYDYRQSLAMSCLASIGFNQTIYSTQDMNASKFLVGGLALNCYLKLPREFIVESTLNAKWFTQRNAGYNANPIIFNASISKFLFPNRQGVIELQCYDLLKQNTSIIRNIGPNYIEDIKSNVLEQFVLLKFSYFFGKKTN